MHELDRTLIFVPEERCPGLESHKEVFRLRLADNAFVLIRNLVHLSVKYA